MYLRPSTHSEISDLIKALVPSRACGPNSFSTYLIKLARNTLSGPLSFIINKSFEYGTFPLLKAGVQDSCGNYQPISLLSNMSKVNGRAMYNRLEQYLKKMQLLSPLQFDFRKKHFTTLYMLLRVL